MKKLVVGAVLCAVLIVSSGCESLRGEPKKAARPQPVAPRAISVPAETPAMTM